MAITALLIATSCSSEETVEPDEFASVADGLCDALNVPEDFASMDEIFDDRVHSGLHDMVAELEDAHRDIAGEILVAKNRVESNLEKGESIPALKDNLMMLLEAVQKGLVTLEMEAPACHVAQ